MKPLKIDDVMKLKHGEKVRLKDGENGPIRGCYMSVDGVIFTVDTRGTGVCRNVPWQDLVDADKED